MIKINCSGKGKTMEKLKLTVEELYVIGSALEDAEIIERRRCVEAIGKCDIERAIYHDEKADTMNRLVKRLYTFLCGKAESEV